MRQLVFFFIIYTRCGRAHLRILRSPHKGLCSKTACIIQRQTCRYAVGQVIGRHNDDHRQQRRQNLQRRLILEGTERIPIEGRDGHGDHYPDERRQRNDVEQPAAKAQHRDEHDARHQRAETAPAARLDVDDGLSDHGAARHAADAAAHHIGDALTAGFPVGVAGRLRHLIHHLLGQQGFDEANKSQGNGVRQDDFPRFQTEEQGRQMYIRQRRRHVTHIADRRCSQTQEYACRRYNDDGNQRGWYSLSDPREQVDDDDPGCHQRIHGQSAAQRILDLGHEDDDGQRIHESGHDTLRNVLDQPAHLAKPHDKLEDPG